MNIKTFLKPFIANNPFQQIYFCRQLKQSIDVSAKDHAGWSFFKQLIEKTYYGQKKSLSIMDYKYHPDNLVQLCKNILNTDDIDILLQWIESFKELGIKTNNLFDTINGQLNLNSLDFPIESQENIENAIKNSCYMEDNYQLKFVDREIRVIPEIHFEPIITASLIDESEYIPEKHDCDDFALRMKAWCSKQGIGNTSIYYIETNKYKKNDNDEFIFTKKSHALNLAVLKTISGSLKVVFLEPQNDKYWHPKQIDSEKNINKLRFLFG